MPDFVLIIYKRARKLIWDKNRQDLKTTKAKVEVELRAVSRSDTPSETKCKIHNEIDSMKKKMCRLEEDNIAIFEKLDHILISLNNQSYND